MKQVKYILSLIGISIIFFSFSNCGSSKSMDSNTKLVETPPFVISNVFSQKWVAGTKEGGSGTMLQVTFQNIEQGISVKNMFFRNNKIEAIQSRVKNQFKGSYLNEKAKDVIMDSDPINEANNTPPTPFPFKLKETELVISYINNGKLEYYKVENIEEKPMLSYPQGNPNTKN